MAYRFAVSPERAQQEAQRLSAFPRVELVHAPTRLERLDRLSAKLNGPTIWVKRDDCTGLAGGGNKIRKLEFLIGAAREERADTVITAGAVQSNHARQVAAAAVRCDLRPILVLTDSVGGRGDLYRTSGNVLIDRLLGADIRLVGDVESGPMMEEIAGQERERGRRPYIIPVGGSNAVGVLGYVAGYFELLTQLHERAIAIDSIILPTGSGGTQAGYILGAHLTGLEASILGISVGAPLESQRAKVAQHLRSAALLLSIEDVAAFKAPLIDDGFVGPGYGQPASQTIDAIQLAAETEGLLLDPVYTGKAMAGLIALIQSGKFRRGENILFLHTGGSQALGAYADAFTS
ncbi:D-cysteine desulfhydrase family protein [Bradyrhizobium sp. Arg237L]|uniref:D-cysteine desulfhydrase family protein n=1 Tax=Bradyrhizobium sp. Arg237L TaxID=3003352 RepID=UPI00249E999D|nr:D-cysteine desulfhydrase family protein [Bradyrhizobium sp. Arg237L]MDI4234598.1 D-cysteine desulfhydrase family protein [Bradyrhizobium sp. Arg237L]